MKPTLEIDGADFRDLNGFWDEVSRVLIPGAKWGRNYHAFNDILRGGFGTPDGGFILVWKNSECSRQRLNSTNKTLMYGTLQTHPEPSVQRVLAEMSRRKFPTEFETLVDIILNHGPGGGEQEDGVDLILR